MPVIFTAKRLEWDEVLSPEQEMDVESYEEHGYESDDLVGELTTIDSEAGETLVVLVGGQQADPKTLKPVPDAIPDPAGRVVGQFGRLPKSRWGERSVAGDFV